MTFRTPVAARYAGMGGASIAFADDHAALLSNPATLGLVRSIEFSAGFDRQSGEMDVRYFGDERTIDFGKTRLSHLGFAYPFPTYRGSLVVGFSYGRVGGLDSGYLRRGVSDRIADREMILEDGGLGSYSAGAALEVSPNLTLGSPARYSAATATVRARRSTTILPYYESTSWITDADFHGITGSVGALAEPGKRPPDGHCPLSARGDRRRHLGRRPVRELRHGQSYADVYSSTDRIDLPFRFGAGLAYARPNLILAADAVYADWTQIDYGGPLRTQRDSRHIVRRWPCVSEARFSSPRRSLSACAPDTPTNLCRTRFCSRRPGSVRFTPTPVREARYESAVFDKRPPVSDGRRRRASRRLVHGGCRVHARRLQAERQESSTRSTRKSRRTGALRFADDAPSLTRKHVATGGGPTELGPERSGVSSPRRSERSIRTDVAVVRGPGRRYA